MHIYIVVIYFKFVSLKTVRISSHQSLRHKANQLNELFKTMDLTRTFVAFHCLDFVLQVAGAVMIAKHLSTSFDCQQNSPII